MMREEWNLLMKGRPQSGWGGEDFNEDELIKMMDDVEAELLVRSNLMAKETLRESVLLWMPDRNS